MYTFPPTHHTDEELSMYLFVSHEDKDSVCFLCTLVSSKSSIMYTQLVFVALVNKYLSVSKSNISSQAFVAQNMHPHHISPMSNNIGIYLEPKTF